MYTMEFVSPPSPVTGYLKAALSRAPGRGEIPRIEASMRQVLLSPSRLARYRKLCGFEESQSLPITIPHILASSLHLAVITHPAFPLKPMGLVHVRNVVRQHRPIDPGQPLDVFVSVEGHRETDSGVEFDLVTKVSDGRPGLAWESVSTNLKRGGGKKDKGGVWTPPNLAEWEALGHWKVPESIGRRYGLMAGDINPIHMHALTAKAFGFPRAIAHGMWTYARCAAEIVGGHASGEISVSASFKRPLLLPGKMYLYARGPAEAREFLLASEDGRTIYLTGLVEKSESKSAAKPARAARSRSKKAD